MGGVVRPKADGEHYQRAERQADGTQPSPPADVWKAGQDEDEVDVAEAADQEGDAEENHEELQAERQQDGELIRGEIQVAGGRRRGGAVGGAAVVVATVCTFAPLAVGYDVDDAEVHTAHHPETDAGQPGIARPATQGIPEGVGDAQVALHTHSGEEQGAVVDGDVEQEASEGTQGEGQQPGHVIRGLLHLKRQESQEDEVGDGEVEEEDVYRGRLATHLAAEGAESQDVGGDPHQEGDDVDGKQQHGGFSHQIDRTDSLRRWLQDNMEHDSSTQSTRA